MAKDYTQSKYAPILQEDGKTITINGKELGFTRDTKSLLHKLDLPPKDVRKVLREQSTSKDEYHKLRLDCARAELGMSPMFLFSWYSKLWYKVHGSPLGLKGYMKRAKKRKHLVIKTEKDVSTKGMRGFL